MNLHSAAKMHVGLVRTNNEDSFLCDDRNGLFAVADGMGGHQAGEVASGFAIDTLKRNAFILRLGFCVHGLIEKAFASAHFAILADIKQHPSRSGMGTTLTALAFGDATAQVAHVGDSRCYLVRDGIGRQLTTDHSISGTSILTNCLGSKPGAHIGTDIVTEDARSGDVFILCSDGLSDYVSAGDLARFVGMARKLSKDAPELLPSRLAHFLVTRALRLGGHDNITVIVVAVE